MLQKASMTMTFTNVNVTIYLTLQVLLLALRTVYLPNGVTNVAQRYNYTEDVLW